MLTALIILAIIISIGIGYFLSINIGFLAMAFSYLIGVGLMDITVKQLISFWPINLFFIIFAVTFFFGFAISNGTMEQVAHRSVYAARKSPALIPFALYAIVAAISGIGPGHYAVYVFLAPFVMSVASRTGMSRVLASVLLVCGGMATTFDSISLGGRVAQGIFEQAGYDTATAAAYTHTLLIDSFLMQTVVFLAAYVALKGYRLETGDIEPPQPFTPQQRKTLWLITMVVGGIVAPPILLAMVPGQPVIAWLAKHVDATFFAILGAVIASILGLAKEKDALAKVPWSVIFLICGVGMLISVAVKAGTVNALSAWLGQHVTQVSAPYITGVSSSMMSFFSSTLGVVMPTLYPIVPGLSAQSGASPTLLFSIIMLCASMTGFSPFSSAGALALAGVAEEGERNRLFYRLLLVPPCGVAIVLLFAFLGVLG